MQVAAQLSGDLTKPQKNDSNHDDDDDQEATAHALAVRLAKRRNLALQLGGHNCSVAARGDARTANKRRRPFRPAHFFRGRRIVAQPKGFVDPRRGGSGRGDAQGFVKVAVPGRP